MTHPSFSRTRRLAASLLCLFAVAGPARAQGPAGSTTTVTNTASPMAPVTTETRGAAATTTVESAAVQTGTARRPKVGVAFGGGAAKGFAHIGVLRWFEENRIPWTWPRAPAWVA